MGVLQAGSTMENGREARNPELAVSLQAQSATRQVSLPAEFAESLQVQNATRQVSLPASLAGYGSNTVVALAESFLSGAFQDQNEGDPSKPIKDSRVTMDAPVQTWQYITFLVCSSLVTFSMPTMSYGLYKVSLSEVLALSSEEAQYIISITILGTAFLSFVPGFMYDACGYKPTILLGGTMATSGALLWCWFLRDGGAPHSPSWHELAMAFLMMAIGTRTMYVAGMCAALCVFPSRLTGTISSMMAVSISVGYIMMPLLWGQCIPPEDDLHAYNPDTHNLASLSPLARFFFVLAAIYASVTVTGLSIAGWLPQKDRSVADVNGSSLGARLGQLRQPSALAILVLVAASLSYVGIFMVSGVAEAARNSGASIVETQSGMFFMGIAGLCGRFAHGIVADLLRNKTNARSAGLNMMFMSAAFCTLIGFLILAFRLLSWQFAACFIGFGFGGLFALFPAAVVMTFGTADAGFWIGLCSCAIGIISTLHGEFCSQMDWGVPVYIFGACGAIFTISAHGMQACVNWGK